MKNGLLLINLGSPDHPTPSAVRRYLREFLINKRVIHLPALLRFLLIYGLILPFRSRKSARAYQAIWTPKGSPLLEHSQNLLDKLQARVGKQGKVALAMCYGKPNIQQALKELQECEQLIILPLYPQYSSSATGSTIVKVLHTLSRETILPSITVIRDFHQHPDFIQAQAEQIRPHLAHHDFILFSYHGVPENHLLQGACKTLCTDSCSDEHLKNLSCYRAQCLRTTSLLAQRLHLTEQQYAISFQSRIGKATWIKPYTNQVLSDLAARGIKRLAVTCPSFVSDCLETLEEIGVRAKAQWLQLGGEQFTLIPCMNDSEAWVNAIFNITIQKYSKQS